MANPIAWQQLAAPDFGDSNNLQSQGANALLKSVGMLAEVAKQQGDQFTLEQTQNLLMGLQQAKTPDEFDAVAVDALARAQQLNNPQVLGKVLEYTDSRPMTLMQRQGAANQLATSDITLANARSAQADQGSLSTILQQFAMGDAAGAMDTLGTMQNPESIITGLDSWYKMRQANVAETEANNRAVALANQATELANKAEAKGDGTTGLGKPGSNANPTTGVRTPFIGSGINSPYYDAKGNLIQPKSTDWGSDPLKVIEAAKPYIMASENSGKMSGVNPLSDATGAFQFIPSTAESAFRSSPELIARYGLLNTSEIMRKLNDPSPDGKIFQDQMYAVEAANKITAMQKANVPITPANLSIAWQLGQGRIAPFLTALERDPNMRLDDLFGQVTVKGGGQKWFTESQGYPRNMTVGDYYKKRVADKGVPTSFEKQPLLGNVPQADLLPIQEKSATEMTQAMTKLAESQRPFYVESAASKLRFMDFISQKEDKSKDYGWFGNDTQNLHEDLMDNPAYAKATSAMRLVGLQSAMAYQNQNANVMDVPKVKLTEVAVKAMQMQHKDMLAARERLFNTVVSKYQPQVEALFIKYGARADNLPDSKTVRKMLFNQDKYSELFPATSKLQEAFSKTSTTTVEANPFLEPPTAYKAVTR